ncbi:DsbA family protein [Vibrio sp. 10N.261.46.E12]|uniref:DsbA family protein n=1 Tax=unclassified Vibrio TaxID=2614977 RepID=UPI000977BC5D|nr:MULTISPECIES: hypothetical protein [unclassified Vibrio]OMO33836.1 hypothetical protein BH584_00590 [Vibrio sp. 10N.261.45.E1]PMJ19334.1 hypothetical protein BCU27_21655 [Vibrio sp. 10N.286.45.B6]PML97975.1 hypothetical protein BCT66_20625 [Vibrio sp. 10N.261.49.E11]PMM83129.1 hypothetical protein BCT46_02320 [Vibrio sp. 10N.261.46.E8]PMN59089.1 hypothetical protein BCT32_22360 [Vibrio sp. 10N.261.45.E11]
MPKNDSLSILIIILLVVNIILNVWGLASNSNRSSHDPKSKSISSYDYIPPERMQEHQKAVKNLSQPSVKPLPISTPPSITKGQLPNWNCDLYYCKDGDPKIYPIKTTLALALNDAVTLDLQSEANPNTVSMVVVFDPTCPECKKYYRNTLSNVLENHGVVKIIPTIFDDELKTHKLREVRKLLCANDVKEHVSKIATNRPTARPYDCSVTLEDARQVVAKTKSILEPFLLSGVTPVTVTKTATWVGYQPYDHVLNHINPVYNSTIR